MIPSWLEILFWSYCFFFFLFLLSVCFDLLSLLLFVLCLSIFSNFFREAKLPMWVQWRATALNFMLFMFRKSSTVSFDMHKTVVPAALWFVQQQKLPFWSTYPYLLMFSGTSACTRVIPRVTTHNDKKITSEGLSSQASWFFCHSLWW